MVIPFVPRALREKMKEADARYAAVARAAGCFALDAGALECARTRTSLARWQQRIEQTKRRVLGWWFTGELTAEEAARLFADAVEDGVRTCEPFVLSTR